ncbi:hypothetical protein NC651_008014 [Populus alba x Populus x berolinensis]|nr:hypothetical protein NC651_008014 [Populus alba x Populus x berolinensis]
MHFLSTVHAKLKHEKKVKKRKKLKAQDAEEKRALELSEEVIIDSMWCGVIIVQPSSRKIPRTIKNTRENDETVCKPNDEEELSHSSFSVIESTISTNGQNSKCFL